MLTIRFTRIGKKNDIKFRLIVKEKRSKRDGAYVDQIGFYDPVASPHKLTIDEKKLVSWIQKGAQLSEGVRKTLGPTRLKELIRPAAPKKISTTSKTKTAPKAVANKETTKAEKPKASPKASVKTSVKKTVSKK